MTDTIDAITIGLDTIDGRGRGPRRYVPESHLDAANARIAELEAALQVSNIAMNDWLAQYAGELCGEEHVKDSLVRIDHSGGTLAYIADVTKANRAALKGDE